MPAAITAKKIAVAPAQKPTTVKKTTVAKTPVTTNKSTAANDICDTCKAIGLPILLARYAPVVFYGESEGLPDWAKNENYRPDLKSISGMVEYVLRILRMGYVYLYYPMQNGQPKKWEFYMVTVSGHLIKQSSADVVVKPTAGVSCKKLKHDSTKLEYLTIQNPEKYSEVYIAFSETNWTKGVMAKYETNKDLRQKRMTLINPKAMSAAKNVAIKGGIVANADNINKIVEYGDYNVRKKSIFQMMPDDTARMYQVADKNGSFKDGNEATLEKGTTGNLWQKRLNKASKTYSSMRVKLMANPGDAYILPLPDEIGVVKELSDMMRQPFVILTKYERELPLELESLRLISGIETLMTQKTDGHAEAYAKAWERYKKSFDYGQYSSFKNNNSWVESAVKTVSNSRAKILLRRLESESFLTALNDYNQEHSYDGLRFEYLMGYIFKGLEQTDAGLRWIDRNVKDLDPANVEKNLVWRTMAYNQKIGFPDLYKIFNGIKAKRDLTISVIKLSGKEKLPQNPFVMTANIMDASKSLSDVFKTVNQEKMTHYAQNVAGKAYSDHFLAAISSRLIGNFAVGITPMSVSDQQTAEAVLARAGVPAANINKLIINLKTNVPLLLPRTASLPIVGAGRNIITGSAAGASNVIRDIIEKGQHQHQARQRIDNAYRENLINVNSRAKFKIPGFFSSSIVFFEAFNFYSMCQDIDRRTGKDKSEAYFKLLASGMAIVGGLTSTTVFVMESVQKGSAVTHGAMKAAAGSLLGTAGFIMGVMDWKEANSNIDKGKTDIAKLYRFKSLLGFSSAAAAVAMGFKEASIRSAIKAGAGYALKQTVQYGVARFVLIFAGWWVIAGSFVVQGIIWYLDKDALQKWLAKTAFEDNEFKDITSMNEQLTAAFNELNEKN